MLKSKFKFDYGYYILNLTGMQNSTSENQEDQGEVSSPPTVEHEDKQAENEEVGATEMTQASVPVAKPRIRTQKEKEKEAAR